jgi:polysaccharide biosynthesis protein PslG
MRKLAAVMTLALCLFAAPAVAEAAPRHFYGVVGGKFDPTPSEFQRMGAGKVGSVRINLAWATVQQNGSGTPYDWGRYDPVVQHAAENGIEVLFTIFGTPGWAAARPNHPPDPPHMDEFEAFLRAAVERYGPNGIYWQLNPAVPKVPVTDWQLFNESNSPTYWIGKPKAKQYKPYLQLANRAIKGVDPNARLILGGLFPTPRIRNGVPLDKYLTDLYKLKTRSLFDAVALHPYSTTPAAVLEAVKDLRELMRGFKDRKKPILLTEVGWASAGQKTPLTVKPKVQAKYLRETFKLAAANRKKLKIDSVYWYTLKDLPSKIWIDNTGLFTTSFSPKPSWNAFVGLTGGKP